MPRTYDIYYVDRIQLRYWIDKPDVLSESDKLELLDKTWVAVTEPLPEKESSGSAMLCTLRFAMLHFGCMCMSQSR
jgi:hypothetical protein